MHYTFLKYLVKWALRLFYHRHQVVGMENIPRKGGVIFAGNHQNALMDALNIICNSGREPYFATRGDLFKKDWMRRLLLSFKMYPVYRLRDGRAAMAQNEAAFQFFAEKLASGGAVGIFPEGEGTYQYKLFPLKKGMARLAFRAVDDNSEYPIYIVPTGLHYEPRHGYQSDLLLQFGKPILVNDYYDAYLARKPRALRLLTEETRARLSELMIDIQDPAEYEAINSLRQRHYQVSTADLSIRFQQGREIVANPAAFASHPAPASRWKIHYFLFFPVLLLGLLLHYPFRALLNRRVRHKVKDSQFISTTQFAYGFLAFPIYYGILAIALWWLAGLYGLAVLPLLPLGGRWAWRVLG